MHHQPDIGVRRVRISAAHAHRDIFTCEFWLGGQHRDSYGEPNQLGHISQYGGGRMQPLWALMFIVLGMGVQGTFAFLFGLILGFVAMEYSLVWSIALHIFNNAILSGAIDTLAGNYLDDNAYFDILIVAICDRRDRIDYHIRDIRQRDAPISPYES